MSSGVFSRAAVSGEAETKEADDRESHAASEQSCDCLGFGVVRGMLLRQFNWRGDERPDVVFADFEGPTYGNWTVEGTAFGDGPAEGALPNQMPVTGYKGRRLVNSFHGGDDAVGTLTSPPFTIARRHVRPSSEAAGMREKPASTCSSMTR